MGKLIRSLIHRPIPTYTNTQRPVYPYVSYLGFWYLWRSLQCQELACAGPDSVRTRAWEFLHCRDSGGRCTWEYNPKRNLFAPARPSFIR